MHAPCLPHVEAEGHLATPNLAWGSCAGCMQELCAAVAPPLAALLYDPAEKCREQAALLLTDAASRLPDPACLLPALSGILAQVPHRRW